MSTTQFAPQLRPLSVGEQLDASFKVVRQSFGTLALCVVVVALPLNIITTLVQASTSDNAFNLDTTTTTADDVSAGTTLAGGLLTGLLGLVLTTIAAAACFRAVSATYLGEQPTWQESLTFAASRVGPLLWLSILYVVGLILPFLFFIIPGVWLSVAWAVSYPALLAEDVRGTKALGRSFNLVKGRWWQTFGAVLVMYLIVLVISGILGALFGAVFVTSLDNEFVAGVLTTIINTISSLVTLPLFAAVLTIIYYDLRVRKEGFDLHLLAKGVGTSAPTDAASVATASGLGGYEGSQGGGFAPPEPGSGGFSPPEAPSSQPPPSQAPPGYAPPGGDQRQQPPAEQPPAEEQPPSPPDRPGPAPGGGLQSGDPLAPPPERREGDS